MTTIRLAVFDVAGTTVNDEGGAVNRCFRQSFADFGLVVPSEAVDAVMGLSKPEAIRTLIAETSDAAGLLDRVDTIHAEFVARMVAHYADDPTVSPVPGVEALFQALRGAGVAVALDTGFSRPIIDVILGRLGWVGRGLVDAVVCSDEVPRGRPSPDMIRVLMDKLGVSDASEVAKIGDAPADLEEGVNAGCGLTVGVSWGTHRRDQLARYGHTHLVDSVAELAELLLTRAGRDIA